MKRLIDDGLIVGGGSVCP